MLAAKRVGYAGTEELVKARTWMPVWLLFAAAFASVSGQCAPGTGRVALIHGVGHAFTITAPAGWVAQAGYPQQPAPAVLYREGQSFADAPSVMYVTTWTADSIGNLPTPEEALRSDSANFRRKMPKIAIQAIPPMQIGDGRKALLRKYVGGGYGSIDIVAYVREPRQRVTPAFSLSARTELDLEEALPSFFALLRSYRVLPPGSKSKHPCASA